MQEQLITFETAKLAKEKGFHQSFLYSQYINLYTNVWELFDSNDANKLDDDFGIGLNLRCSAPTQSLLQKWLREEHGILIHLFPNSKGHWWVNLTDETITCKITYEEALEAGLQEALKLI